MSSFIYLASPYNDPDEHVRLQRYHEVLDATHYLLSRKFWCYSPIVHCHELARLYNLPKDHTYWSSYNAAMLRGSDSLMVLQLPGWEASRGVQGEIDYAFELGIPIRSLRAVSDGYAFDWSFEKEIADARSNAQVAPNLSERA